MRTGMVLVEVILQVHNINNLPFCYYSMATTQRCIINSIHNINNLLLDFIRRQFSHRHVQNANSLSIIRLLLVQWGTQTGNDGRSIVDSVQHGMFMPGEVGGGKGGLRQESGNARYIKKQFASTQICLYSLASCSSQHQPYLLQQTENKLIKIK